MGSEGEMLPDGIDDNILSEILLRLPPQPPSLPRASAVCKRWHSLACNPGFCRRFRRHHRRNAPLLGFFDPDGFVPTLDAPNLAPPGRFSLLADGPDRYMSCGSRHGLVLIFDKGDDFRHILVWDPVTGDQYRISIPPDFEEDADIRGAVLRDAGDVHFRVVLDSWYWETMKMDNIDERSPLFTCQRPTYGVISSQRRFHPRLI